MAVQNAKAQLLKFIAAFYEMTGHAPVFSLLG